MVAVNWDASRIGVSSPRSDGRWGFTLLDFDSLDSSAQPTVIEPKHMPDDQLLASMSADGTVLASIALEKSALACVWRSTSDFSDPPIQFSQAFDVVDDDDPAWVASLSLDGSVLAVSFLSGTILLFDVLSTTLLLAKTDSGCEGAVVAISPSIPLIAYSGITHVEFARYVSDGRQTHFEPAVSLYPKSTCYDLSFSANGELLTVIGSDAVRVLSRDWLSCVYIRSRFQR